MSKFDNIKTIEELDIVKEELDFTNTGDILWYERERKRILSSK